MSDWDIGLFSCGEWKSCCYSYCFPGFAAAEAKGFVDNSEFIISYLCGSVFVNRYLTRTAYGIRGDCWSDCLASCCCPCCVANQMYQTAYNRGLAVSDAGRHMNVHPSSNPTCNFGDCMYSCCCMPCATGSAMEKVLGMPFLMGCLCLSPCYASNIARYHYRLKGSDIASDLITPTCLMVVGYYCAGMTCCLSMGIIYPYAGGKIMTILGEARRFGHSPQEAGYMRGFHPSSNPAAYQMVQAVAHQGQVMVAPQGSLVYASEVVKT